MVDINVSLNYYNDFMKEDSITNEEFNRYSRQIFIEEIGVVGQRKIKNAKVLIVGAGGLGVRLFSIWRRQELALSGLQISTG